MILLPMILPILRRRFAAETWDAKGLACPTLGLRSALPRDSAIVCLGRDAAPPGSDLRGNAAFASSRDAALRLKFGAPAARRPYLGLRL